MVKKKGFSLEGWNFKAWLTGNKKSIKEVLKVGLPYWAATLLVNDLALVSLITTAGKLTLDAIEYYIKER